MYILVLFYEFCAYLLFCSGALHFIYRIRTAIGRNGYLYKGIGVGKSLNEQCGICKAMITTAEPAYILGEIVVCAGCFRRHQIPPVQARPPAERCANCDTPFGRLERPQTYENHPVCIACYTKLSQVPSFECKGCGYTGMPAYKKKNSNFTKALSLGMWGPLALGTAMDNEKIPYCPECGWDGIPIWKKNIF